MTGSTRGMRDKIMMNFKKTGAIFMALFLLLGCAGAAYALPPVEERDYCVRLYGEVDGSTWPMTGALVGINYDEDIHYIATNSIITNTTGEMEDKCFWYVGDMTDAEGNLTTDFILCTLDYIHSAGTIAVYTTSYSAASQYVDELCPRADMSPLQEGDTLTMLYTSAEAPYPAGKWDSRSNVKVSGCDAEVQIIVMDYQIETSFMDGGLLYTEDDECVGMVTALYDEDEDTLYLDAACGFGDIASYLDAEGASYTYDKTSGSILRIVGIVAGIAVVIGIVILVRKKKEEAVPVSDVKFVPEMMTPQPAPAPEPAAVPQPAAPQSQSQPQSVLPVGSLKGLSGVYRNEVFQLSNPLIRVGRDPQTNQIILPSDAVGVSREHCYLMRTENGWSLTDISSNGTLLNGVRITKNQSYALKVGDQIQIGDPPHVFLVSQ